jgi:hypothetical protein
MSWFGAQSIVHGVDPYPLVGKGRVFDYRWPLTYPAPSLVALIPFGFLSEHIAATLFVFLSTFFLAFGVTEKGGYLLPLFVAEPFLNAARLGQWNIALTASLFVPWLAFFGVAKPQAIAAILAATRRSSAIIAFIAGALVLLALSFILVPAWVSEWIASVHQMPSTRPAVMRLGGFLALLVLLRWRRPEAWLVAVLACVPQTAAFYSTLPLFTVPRNFKESCILLGTTMIGGFLGAMFVGMPKSLSQLDSFVGALQIFTIYLPVVVFVLLRPNEGPSPAWLTGLLRERNTPS